MGETLGHNGDDSNEGCVARMEDVVHMLEWAGSTSEKLVADVRRSEVGELRHRRMAEDATCEVQEDDANGDEYEVALLDDKGSTLPPSSPCPNIRRPTPSAKAGRERSPLLVPLKGGGATRGRSPSLPELPELLILLKELCVFMVG